MVNDLKKELSKLSGVDFFNPKFRDVFKKYFPNDNNESDVNTNEEDRLQEVIGEEKEENENKTDIENEEKIIEETVDEEDVKEEGPAEPAVEQTTEESVDEVVEENPADEIVSDIPTEEVKEEPKDENGEILELKLELELIKANIRKDRLEAAKQLFMHEIHSMDDLEKVPSLVERYPEWVNKDRAQAQPFGMPVADMGDGLTAEEKRLKSMGIDPRA